MSREQPPETRAAEDMVKSIEAPMEQIGSNIMEALSDLGNILGELGQKKVEEKIENTERLNIPDPETGKAIEEQAKGEVPPPIEVHSPEEVEQGETVQDLQNQAEDQMKLVNKADLR